MESHSKAISHILPRCKNFFTLNLRSRLDILLKEAPSQKHIPALKSWKSNDGILAQTVMLKLEEGNFRSAVNAVCSEDTVAPFTPANLASLKAKHPQAPADRRSISDPAQCLDRVEAATTQAIHRAVFSFPAGSAGGPDGLIPQHIKDLVRLEGSAGALVDSLAAFSSVVLQGSIPESIKPLFFSARLTAFCKKDGGLRPIAVGNVLRRLAAKIAAEQTSSLLKATFAPLQFGVAVPEVLNLACTLQGNFSIILHRVKHW